MSERETMTPDPLRSFTQALLADLDALESMLGRDVFERGVRRVGAEQEMFLVDRSLDAAPLALDVLARAGDARLTTEIALFNLEGNLTPRDPAGDGLRELERETEELIATVRRAARAVGADVLLAGILPTLRRSDLSLANLTPLPRYQKMSRAVNQLRGGAFRIHIRGADEIDITHDNVMMEAANTSFQLHVQVSPEEFADRYNAAQLISAPVLAAAVNSPLLLGQRLWHETRLALFQHAVDERSPIQQARARAPRVTFGDHWIESSVLEIYRDQIARYRPILTAAAEEDPRDVLARGDVPALSALRLHNGTVWRWNRPCYGVSGGKAHLRIENRMLPAGPTVRDEIANMAFFLGLLAAAPEEYGRIRDTSKFDDVRSNFFAAARYGLDARVTWPGHRSLPVTQLIRGHLLGLARAGLAHMNVDSSLTSDLLAVIEQRVDTAQTGSQWSLSSLESMRGRGTPAMRHRALARAMLDHQARGAPVHTWPPATLEELEEWPESYRTVGQFMSTDLVTVRQADPIELAAGMMSWHGVRHVPVEDDEGHLAGIVSTREILRVLSSARGGALSAAVSDVMRRDPPVVTPATSTLDAIELMRRSDVDSLAVVEEGRLVGIITAQDFLNVSVKLFEHALRRGAVQRAPDAFSDASKPGAGATGARHRTRDGIRQDDED